MQRRARAIACLICRSLLDRCPVNQVLLLEVSICTHNVGDSDLEKKVVKIFEKVCYSIEGNNIKACNWKSQKK